VEFFSLFIVGSHVVGGEAEQVFPYTPQKFPIQKIGPQFSLSVVSEIGV